MVVKSGTGKKQSGFLKLKKIKSEPVDILVEAVENYEEDVPDEEEAPIKCVSTVMNYQINCGIQFINFDGRNWRHKADCITLEVILGRCQQGHHQQGYIHNGQQQECGYAHEVGQ
jgi:hypothetical protein